MRAVETVVKIGLKNILYLTDFSRSAEFAFGAAQGLARKFDARMIVAHVLEPAEYQFVPQQGVVETTVGVEESAKKELLQLEKRITGIPHELLLSKGEVWDAVTELVRKNKADLLVMGTHGRTGLRRLLMGSVAERVFRQAHCPVITVGPRAAGNESRELKIKRVLFATDFGAESQAALGYALSIAEEFLAELTMVHVERVPLEPLDSPAVLVTEGEKAMAAMIPEEATSWCKPEYKVRFGDPAKQILKVAEEVHADLIVLGAKASNLHPAIATHVIMATAHKVVCDAECPVLSVRG
ncbi:MAG TPA: universal stress protein [Candidatus Acidoferrum sp.]|nr:universal stress protein [Candidatus Acidoferrum sp.]